MLFVISLVFIFYPRYRFPSELSIAEVLRKRYGERISKLVKKFENADIKYKRLFLISSYKIIIMIKLNFKTSSKSTAITLAQSN